MRIDIKALLLLLVWTGMCIPVRGVIVYVSPTGSGAGSSWADAANGAQLQTLINALLPGDQVWVMTGTYLPTIGAGRNATFTMRNGVKIYGSFSGTETDLSQRSLANGPNSILSGAIGTASMADNSFHVVTNGTGLDTTALLDGFVIRDGNDDRSPNVANNGLGGGIFNNGGGGGAVCNPQIRNCVITNNFAQFGGGIFNSGQSGGNASPYIKNCIIVANGAYIGGGGLDNFGLAGNANPGIVNTLVISNVAGGRAGGMYCWGGNNGNANPSVLNSVFAYNTALDTFPTLPDGFDGGGGGIVADRVNSPPGSFSGNANPVFRNCIFWGNTTPGTGPQFELLGGATFAATYSDVNLTGQAPPHVISGPGTGNINADPLFLNSALGAGVDGFWLTSDDGFILQSGSPCLNVGDNAGLPSGDIRNHARIADLVVEMGAYESNSSLLPIFAMELTGAAVGNHNHLQWRLEHRIGSKTLEIQRSSQGMAFETIQVLDQEATSYNATHGSFVDEQVVASRHWYRLQMIDNNGHVFHSETILIQNEDHAAWSVYPNPSNGHLNIIGGEVGPMQVQIRDMAGRLVLEQSFQDGSNGLALDGLPSGMYSLRLYQSGHSEDHRVVKE
ncbi:MAG: T9SS type A sorting domain-containing protein [Bacteroidia bacterium]